MAKWKFDHDDVVPHLSSSVIGSVRRQALNPNRVKAHPMSAEVYVRRHDLKLVFVSEQTGERVVVEMDRSAFDELSDHVRSRPVAWPNYVCSQCGDRYGETTDPVFEECECGGNYIPNGE